MKCFERLVLAHVKSTISQTHDQFQFAFRENRSTEDAIATALHFTISHLDIDNTCVRMLFIDFSSAFNTILPSKLIQKLTNLDIDPLLCNWILDFLVKRPQQVRIGSLSSSTITLNTGLPQGCVLSPLLYSLYTSDCTPVHGSNHVIKFADDTTVIGLIKNNDERAYMEEVQHQVRWCAENNLALNTSKTKEIVVDFRRSRGGQHAPIIIDGVEVERVTSFKFLGVHISTDLSWTLNTSSLIKKAHQRLFFLRRLRKAKLSRQTLKNFYRCAVESTITYCITAWYGNCTVAERKSLQRVVKTAQRIIGSPLPPIESIYKQRCQSKALSIIKDASHPNNRLFHPSHSQRRRGYRCLKTSTTRSRNSFFPSAIILLNSLTK